MLKYFIPLFFATTLGHAAIQTVTPKDGPENALMPPPPQIRGSSVQSYMMISASARAADLQQAFDMLRKEKTAGKIYFQLADGTTIFNVIDFTPMSNSTLFLFRFNSSQGIRFQLVKVEDILTIGY